MLADFSKLMGCYAVACHDINQTSVSSADRFNSLTMSFDNMIQESLRAQISHILRELCLRLNISSNNNFKEIVRILR